MAQWVAKAAVVMGVVGVLTAHDANDQTRVCCKAMLAQCQACFEGVDVKQYCTKHPSEFDCPSVLSGLATARDSEADRDVQDENVDTTLMAFGSCSKPYLAQPVWESVLRMAPQLWLWTGDAV